MISMLTGHLLNAAFRNACRLPLYALRSRGASISLSLRLLLLEVGSLPGGLLVDLLALPIVLGGIPVVAADFVEGSPPYRPDYADGPPVAALPLPVGKLAARLRSALNGDFERLSGALEQELQSLPDPRCHCMTRHLLESMRRISNNAVWHSRRFALSGVLSRALLKAHVVLLDVAADLDRQAMPLQLGGIPILFQDLCAIPPLAGCYLPPRSGPVSDAQ